MTAEERARAEAVFVRVMQVMTSNRGVETISDALADARRGALEEAAQWVSLGRWHDPDSCAKGIRALDAACACGDPEDVVHIHGFDMCWRPCRGECGRTLFPGEKFCHQTHALRGDKIKAQRASRALADLPPAGPSTTKKEGG